MIEHVYFPIHGNKRPGTGYQCYGGFGYGATDPVTLKPDRGTDLFAPSLTTKVEDAAAGAHGDTWLKETPAGATIHAPKIKPSGAQPPTMAVTTGAAAKQAGKDRAAAAKANAQVARIQKAILAGRVSPKDALAKAQRAAEHGMMMAQAAHDARNSIAIIQAQILRDSGKGKSLAAHQRVLNRMHAQVDHLEEIASRDKAIHAATRVATSTTGMADYIQLSGFGQEPGDARDVEEHGAELVVQAAHELGSGNVGAAEVTIANAEGAFQQADTQMSAEAAAGDVFAQVSDALQPSKVPWGKIAVIILIAAAARQALR